MTKLLSFSLCCCSAVVMADYDPLAVRRGVDSQTIELKVTDESRERDVPIKIYLPASRDPAPVVLFSHGLGGTREGCVYLGRHWSARGYAAVFLQHPGSDDSVWKDKPLLQRMAAMRRAASAQNFQLRVQDVAVVLDQLDKWDQERKHPLNGRLDMERVGMSGHSFGAVTTQDPSSDESAKASRYWLQTHTETSLPPERMPSHVELPLAFNNRRLG